MAKYKTGKGGDIIGPEAKAGVITGRNSSISGDVVSNIGEAYGQDTAKALREVAEFIKESKNPVATSLFNSFTEELNKPQPDKSNLRSFWEGIKSSLPSIATISESVAKIVSLFAEAH